MNRNVVSLETAKRLKAAGFGQTTANGWNYSSDTPAAAPEMARRTYYLQEGADFGAIAAPTAQELADELPVSIKRNHTSDYFLPTRKYDQHGYEAMYTATVDLMAPTHRPLLHKAAGPTLAEALAALWLKLQELSK